MPADVRVNEVTTDVNVTDASAMMSSTMLDRIVQAVVQRLKAQQQSERGMAQEQSLGSDRQQQ